MGRVFHAVGAEVSEYLERIHCKDETKELQERLHAQPELLAGDQIRPEDPRQWLLVRREMPVINPTTGLNELSLDFLYVDQDGTPTLVEVKRCNDARARREVVGQMLEYAANGRAYWETDDLVRAFVETNKGAEEKATANLRHFRGDSEETLAAFFEQVIQKLRKGILRLVFFLGRLFLSASKHCRVP